jgi:glycerol kinase
LSDLESETFDQQHTSTPQPLILINMKQQPTANSQPNEPSAGHERRSNAAASKAQGATAGPLGPLIGAIDQGTSSTRFLVFEQGTGRLVASSQIEMKRLTPREGWVEIDPNVLMSSVYATMANVHDQLLAAGGRQPANDGIDSSIELNTNANNKAIQLECIGICNQRESTVVWDSITGQPLYNVIVWMDNRTKDIVDKMIDSVPGRDFNQLKDKTGLPMSTYFSAFKLKWLIDNVDEVRSALAEKRLLFGTVDTWILWNLTGKHLTDVTNASRTFLMDIETLQWDKSLCKQFNVPMQILPKIMSSADDFGQVQCGPFKGAPITGVIGDQSAALFGHHCLQVGQTKATFGK